LTVPNKLTIEEALLFPIAVVAVPPVFIFVVPVIDTVLVVPLLIAIALFLPILIVLFEPA